MLYIVYFSDGSTAIFDEQTLANLLQACMYDPNFCGIVSYALYEPAPPPPPPPPEEPPPAPPCSISISAPGSAQEGERVSLSATITNNSPYAQLYKTKMYANEEFIGSIEDTIPGYSSRTYGGSFVMPASDVTILIWVEVWRVDRWDYNNSASKGVALYILPPTEAGKIVNKWVNKAPEGNYLPMPASVKTDGNTFEVGVSYRNDSPVNITGGVEVKVTKPDGSVVAPAIDWSGIGIGQTLNKQYNIAAVNQVGNWPIVIRFLAKK